MRGDRRRRDRTGSLKARLCVAGRDALYAYCEERGIAHRRCGKLIVATSQAQQAKLLSIHAQAQANGCSEVSVLSAAQAKEMEPALSCAAALLSPMTGIIDSHAYMLSLQADAEHAGAMFAFNSRIASGTAHVLAILLHVETNTNKSEQGGGGAGGGGGGGGRRAPRRAAAGTGRGRSAGP